MNKITKEHKELLFKLATASKERGETLTSVFEQVANACNMSKGSIRNFYYKEIRDGKINNSLKEKLEVKKVVEFTKTDEINLVRNVLRERKNCTSLNSTFLKIAKGDKVLALRFRNKFANMVKKQRAIIMREVLFQKSLSGNCFNPYIYKKERLEKNKLKGEIEELIKIIEQKCAKENSLLKKKLIKYHKLNGDPLFNVYNKSNIIPQNFERDENDNLFLKKEDCLNNSKNTAVKNNKINAEKTQQDKEETNNSAKIDNKKDNIIKIILKKVKSKDGNNRQVVK